MPFLRKYGTLTVTGTTAIRIPMIKRAVVDFAVGADWTPVAGDVKIAVDGTAPANVANLPTAVASGNGAFWEFILTAAELTCKQAVVTIVDAATKAVEDQAFIVETCGNASAMYAADLTLANLPVNVVQWNASAVAAPNVAGVPKVDVVDWLGTAPAAPNVAGVPKVDVVDWLGTAPSVLHSGLVQGDVQGWLNQTIPAVNVPGVPLVDLKYTLGTISPAAAGSVRADAVTGAVGSVTGAVGSVTGAVGSVTGNVGGNVLGSVASIVNAGIDLIFDRAAGVETNYTLRQALRLILSSTVAKLSGAATATILVRDLNDTKNRITLTVDASGNRSAVTTDVS